jgi:hypothetical protein
MGDQDFKITLDEYNLLNKIYNIKSNPIISKFLGNNKSKAVLSSSLLWKSIGFSIADRIDLFFKDRIEEESFAKKIIFDLNFELNDSNLFEKYDLVTDFGNNEHPFNIKETFKTMHKLCKKDGYILSMQSLINGNGFYNFNNCFYEHLAAFNNYSIIYSWLSFGFKNTNKYLHTPADMDYLKYINFDNSNSCSINYLFKKNSLDEFKVPYQGMGYDGKKNMLFNIDFKGNIPPLEQIYLPITLESISINNLVKEVFSRLKKIKTYFKYF